MDFLKDAFGDKALTFADLQAALKDHKEIKIANLASGQYVAKDKFDTAETTVTTLKKQLDEANTTIKGFESLDVDGLKNGIKTWEEKYKTDTEALTSKLNQQAIDSKIDVALMGAKAKNLTAVKALLKADAIKLDGETVIGLKDQLDSIVKDNPYLFGEPDKNPAPGGGGNPTPPPADSLAGALADHYKQS